MYLGVDSQAHKAFTFEDGDPARTEITVPELRRLYEAGSFEGCTISMERFATLDYDWNALDTFYKGADQ